MRHGSFCSVLRVLALVAASTVLAQPTGSSAQAPGAADLPALVVLVRHGDTVPEPGGNPHLAPAGTKRAQDLAAALRGTKLSAIIITQWVRTRETAQPLASALGLAPEVVTFNPQERDAHVKAVETAVRKHTGGSVLVVGHTSTLPPIIAALGGPAVPRICETVFDNLFVLVPVAGRMQLVHSRYGAASPTPGPDCQ